MVSIGPNSQSNNFTHMFDFVDLRGTALPKKQDPNSLMGVINNTPEFSKFKYIVETAMMDDILGSLQSEFTLFIPSDCAIESLDILKNIDISLARHIIKTSMLDRKIPSEILEDSSSSYFRTNDSANRLLIRNISGVTYINDNIKIIYKDITTLNGIIHVVDNLIWPEYLI